jgi:hypothetical protein
MSTPCVTKASTASGAFNEQIAASISDPTDAAEFGSSSCFCLALITLKAK